MIYHEIDNGIGSSLHSVILWQYENAEKLKAFIESMCEAAYLAVDDFWDKWATFRTNVDLAASKENATFSLSVIGATCGIPRPNNISDAMYAKLIKCRMKLSMTTSATTADYKAYIDDLFGEKVSEDDDTPPVIHVSLVDNLDMSVSTTYNTSETTGDYYVLYHSEDSNDYGKYWLILPTGVKRGISSWEGTVFGFDKHDAGTGTNSRIPAIGPFGTSFMTYYQYQFIKEAST